MKGDHSRKLTFLVFAYSKHLAFPLTEVSASEVPAFLKESWKIDLGSRHFETNLAARPCLCDVIPSDSNLAARSKTCNWLGIFYKVNKIHFFQVIFHFTIFDAIISEFGACLAQNTSSEAISRTELRHENAAWLLGTVQNDSNHWRQRCSHSEPSFTRKTCTLEVELRWVAKL